MNVSQIKSLVFKGAVVFWTLALIIYVVSYDQFRYIATVGDTLSATMVTREIVDGDVVQQRLRINADSITGFDIKIYNFGRSNSGTLHADLFDADGNMISSSVVDIATLDEDNTFITIPFGSPAVSDGHNTDFVLQLYTEGCSSGNAIGLYSGNSVVAGRFDVYKEIASEDVYWINNQPGNGMLCLRLNGIIFSNFYITYWYIVGGVFLVGVLYCIYAVSRLKKGKNSFLNGIATMLIKYGFLLKQLVSRDFKIKYKRSSLGMLWSFLNPLLTMAVQYVVFSTLFKSDIPNYPVYLLVGIVLFNFFNEAVSSGMVSITSNAALIKKVYMPRYIYPVSKICSSLINFVLSFIPIFFVMLFTGTHFSLSLLLLVYCLLCMVMFILGMVLIMTTLMTFFQDTQFIWTVVSMIWMYATPIFYPESIIPANYLTVYHLNPLYQFVTFARVVIIDGVSPAPSAYLWCLLPSIVVFFIGALVFKKKQDKFILAL